MADVKAFKAYRYNNNKVNDLSKVICPPYDVISKEQEETLRARSPYNYINLEEGEIYNDDNDQNNKYTRTSALLNKWINEDILKRDSTPSFYLHEQTFSLKDQVYTRHGIIACVRLYEWDEMIIRPHEGTLSGPKTDRLNLIWALNANTSSVFALYEDRDGVVKEAINVSKIYSPVLDTWVDGEHHVLHIINDMENVTAITQAFASKTLYIADGHHRYESALYYRNELNNCSGGLPQEHAANYVMMTLVDFDDSGLLILPPHRVLKGLSQPVMENLFQNLNNFFDVTEVDMKNDDYWAKAQELFNEKSSVCLGLYGLAKDDIFKNKLLILTLKDLSATADMMPYHHSDMYKKLDVSIVDHIILEEMLGLNSREESMISYVTDKNECIKLIDDGEYQLCFFVKAVTPDDIRAIADARDRMPRKSTYFYPKLPSGLTINGLD